MATQGREPRTGPLGRVQGVDLSMTGELLKAAIQLIVPEDQTQRKAFEQLMPHLYVLRHKGCSWAQLASLLADGGFKLQPSTVRNYFGEMVQRHMDACQESMTEQLLLLKEIRKETAGVDMSLIKERVSTVMENQRAAAAAKIDARFGVGAAAPLTAVRREPASPAHGTATANASAGLRPVPEQQQQQQQQQRGPASPAHETATANASAGLRPVPEQQRREPASPALKEQPQLPEQEDTDDCFGLLNPSNAPSPTTNSTAFFSLNDDAPTIPDLSPRNNESAKIKAAASPQNELQPQNANFSCLPIPPGVKPLAKRMGVNEDVYKIGELEHPAVAGIMLTMAQRLSSLPLEFVDNNSGEIRFETAEEKRFRVKWEKPVPVTHTTTATHFTSMDMTLFRKKE